jgi:hypothetical protein
MQDEDRPGGSNSGSIRHGDSTSNLDDLPVELLASVMSMLDVKQRCGGLAGTCHKLAAAAAAATKELQLSNINQQQADALALWLAKHSSKVLSSVDIRGSTDRDPAQLHGVRLDLPVDKLVQLKTMKLSSLNLQQYSTVSGRIIDFRAIRQLGMLSGLQHLELSRLPAPTPTGHDTLLTAAAMAYSAALSTALGQLTQLTALTLSTDCSWWLPGTAMAPGSSLSQLQRLTLEGVGTTWQPMQQEALPSSLVSLSIRAAHIYGSSGWEGVTWKLPVLKRLYLDETFAHENVLLGMPLLDSLEWHASLDDQRLVSIVLHVLSWAQLQHLTKLCLPGIKDETAAPEYAALTASSQLEHLQLFDCIIPPAAAQFMFPAGRCLPHLRTVDISGMFAGPGMCALTLGAGDAGRLAACCPGLQSLSRLELAAVSAAKLHPLLQLSALTKLVVEGAACDDEVAEQVLAKLTGEQALLRMVWIETALACSA